MVVAGALLMLPVFSMSGHAQAPAAGSQAAPAKTTYTGDVAIVMYAINPGKEADYEQVIAKLKDALGKSTAPEAKQQLAGWKIFKSEKPLTADGPTYIHLINPVVKGADYNIVQIVYGVSTDDEKLAFYNLYKGALKGALSLVQAKEIGGGAAAPGGGTGAPGAQ